MDVRNADERKNSIEIANSCKRSRRGVYIGNRRPGRKGDNVTMSLLALNFFYSFPFF